MKFRNLWRMFLGLLPAYGAYNAQQLHGDMLPGLLAGLMLAALLYGIGAIVSMGIRKLRGLRHAADRPNG